MRVLKFGIPKGSLQDATVELLSKAGWKLSISARNYFPKSDDEELSCALIRPQEMPKFVEDGILDAGLTGKDWVLESGCDVSVVENFIYSKATQKPARWVLVVANDSPIKKIEDLEGKRISTELVNFTKRYFKEKGINVHVEFSWGATEAKVVEGLVDAIVELTETGTTIKAHGLKIIEELLVTNTQLIASKEALADPWKAKKIEQIKTLLLGALCAKNKVILKMNVKEEDIEEVSKILPSLKSPTVAKLYGKSWYSLEAVVDENLVRDLIPKLIEKGAEDIIELPLNKVI